MRLVLALLLVLGVADGASLEEEARWVGRRHARAFVKLAQRAAKENQLATARLLFLRAIELDADNQTARRAIGFRRKADKWMRPPEVAAAFEQQRDDDTAKTKSYRGERNKLELAYTAGMVRACKQYGTPDRARRFLLPRLRYTPRDDALHEALGHPVVDGRRVRPELAEFARALPKRLALWRATGRTDPARITGETVQIAGLPGVRPLFRVGSREFASGFPPKSTAWFARRIECVHRMLRLMLGDEAKRWDLGPVYFLDSAQYRAFLTTRNLSISERSLWIRRRHFWAEDAHVFAARDLSEALDFYAHAVAIYTIGDIRSPFPKDDSSRDIPAWLMEGFGLLITLELFDSAETFVTSGRETGGKLTALRPPPRPIRRAAALEHVREELYRNTLPSLHQLLGTSMNGLDETRSLQAWTLVRFLALSDPEAFRKLPDAVREQKGESRSARSSLAIQSVFGLEHAEFERLWRIYLLEIS